MSAPEQQEAEKYRASGLTYVMLIELPLDVNRLTIVLESNGYRVRADGNVLHLRSIVRRLGPEPEPGKSDVEQGVADMSDEQNETKPKISIHCCHQPGLTMGNASIKQMPNGTWEARAKIGAIFGAEVEGECKGKGDTKEEALAALKKDQDDLYGSMWV